MIKASELETVIAILPIPFRKGGVDFDAHARNAEFLIQHNWLDRGRKRAIATGGTSLVHHIEPETLLRLNQVAGETISSRAMLIAGVIPSPITSAYSTIKKMLELEHPPDFFLLMPVPGVTNPAGLERDLSKLLGEFHPEVGDRFLLYMRRRELLPVYSRMLNKDLGLVGIKVGTEAEDVGTLRRIVSAEKVVLWGVGDRATRAAEHGSRGHTSGITLICPRLCDEINNAYRRENFAESYRLEKIINEFEEIRFMEERAHNYSAVVAAAKIGGFQDIDLGEGGPFNEEPPAEVLHRLEKSMEVLVQYH